MTQSVKIEKVTKPNGTTYFVVESASHVELFFFGGLFIATEKEAFDLALDYAKKVKDLGGPENRELVIEL